MRYVVSFVKNINKYTCPVKNYFFFLNLLYQTILSIIYLRSKVRSIVVNVSCIQDEEIQVLPYLFEFKNMFL